MSTPSVTSSTQESFTGRVKWFNNRVGYGFITVTDGSRSGTDVFVHHSAINVSDQQYKYLVQGEYVEFTLITAQGGAHEFQASEVTGVNSGKLMCETRNEFKTARKTYKSTHEDEDVEVEKQSAQPATEPKTPRTRGEGPRDAETKGTWKVVSDGQKRTSGKPRGRPPRAQSTKQ